MRKLRCGTVLWCSVAACVAQQFAPLVRPTTVGGSSAFDTVRRRLVLFGEDGTTWELDGGGFTALPKLAGAAVPPIRSGHAMCFDEARQRVLMFGGRVLGAAGTLSTIADTWSWDGRVWTRLTLGPIPPGRDQAAITFDSLRARVVMFGGQGLADTWEHDGTSWLQRTPSTVPGSILGSMAFDRQRGVAVLIQPAVSLGGAPQTFEWNGSNWSLRSSSGPPFSSGATLAFDPLRNRTVLVGGLRNDHIWEWDGAVWQQRTLPQPLRLNQAASWFDPACGCIAIAGGTGWQWQFGQAELTSAPVDVRAWDGQVLTVTRTEVGPAGSLGAVLIPDPLRGRVVRFGGQFGGASASDQAWAFDGSGWTRLLTPVAPSARAKSGAAFDPTTGEALLFGGNQLATLLGDTWSLGASGWVPRAAIGPSPRIEAAMATDFSRGVVVLFGGFNVAGPTDDTWEWNGAAWTLRATTVRPPARYAGSLAYHVGTTRIVLFGGRVDGTVAGQLADTWTWDGSQWTQLSLSTNPPALGEVSMHTNLGSGDCILIGITGTGAALRQQVWTFGGANWQLQLEEVPPLGGGQLPRATGVRLDTVTSAAGVVVYEFSFRSAQVAELGLGCGASTTAMRAAGRPRIGTPLPLEVAADPGRAVLFGLGLSSSATPLGGGCTLWLGAGFVGQLQIADPSGLARQIIVLPPNPTLRGLDAFAQAAVFEPAGLALTQGLRLTMGD